MRLTSFSSAVAFLLSIYAIDAFGQPYEWRGNSATSPEMQAELSAAWEKERSEARESNNFVEWDDAEAELIERCPDVVQITTVDSRVVWYLLDDCEKVTIRPRKTTFDRILRSCRSTGSDLPIITQS